MNAALLLWENRAKLTIAALTLLCLFLSREIKTLRVSLAAKPKIEDHVVTKTVVGPVRIVEKIVTTPGGEKIVERVITREVVVKDSNTEHTEAPVCPAQPAPPRWVLGASLDPFKPSDAATVRGGVTLFNRLDLTVGHTLSLPGRSEAGVGVRF